MTERELAQLRRDYSRETLRQGTVDPDPFAQFSLWMNEALDSEILDATAMTLCTVDAECRPSARVVLLKAFDSTGFTFFTNYESQKARELAGNPNAVLHFFWPELERQLIIQGSAEKTTREVSEIYFKSRPLESRLSAWASKQSSVIESRKELEKRVEALRQEFDGEDIPVPPFWGGFRVTPVKFEFWQGRASRLHDRICYELLNGEWRISRLSP